MRNFLWIHITFENNLVIKNFLRNISRGVVGSVLIKISPSNIFPIMLSVERFHQNCWVTFGSCES